MRLQVRSALIAGILALVPLLAAAADPKAARYYEDALGRYEKKDMAGAVIQLKNALQIDRSMLAAHVLLGKALQSNGDLPAAEAAFEEALRLGVNRGEVIVPLGQIYLLQGKYETLLERITTAGLAAPLQAEVLVLRANALNERGDKNAASRALDEARQADPASLSVRLAQIALFLRNGDLARAASLSEDVIAQAPGDASAWNARGSILHMRGDAAGALAAYGKAIALGEKYFDPRIARAGLLIDQGRWTEAEADVTELQRLAGEDPRVAYLRSLVAARRGDAATVNKALADITKALDQAPAALLNANRQMLFLAGLAHYGLRNHEKAVDHLSNYLRQYPGEPGPTKLLASLYLERGDSTRVIALLSPLLRTYPNDGRALALLANAHMLERNYRQATALLDQAVKASGGASDIRTDFGLSLVVTGNNDKGIEQLQQVFAKDARQTRAGLALAMLQMRNGQPKRALEVVESMVKAAPANLTALNMAGAVRLATGDAGGARKAYEQVLAQDPGYQAAILNLARLDVREGKIEAARQRLAQILKSDIVNVDAMIELAAVEERAGRVSEAVRWLEKARSESKGTVRGGSLLAELHLRTGNLDQALAVAKDTAARLPESLSALGILARTQLASRDNRGARQTLADMTRYANYDPDAQLEIARLQMAAGNDSGATYSLEKALGTRPDWLPALVMYAEVNIAQRDYAKAEQRIRGIAEKYPGNAVISRLQGDLALARGQHAAAVASYTAGLKKDSAPDLPLRIFQAHLGAGELNKGLAFLEKWQKEHPGNATVLRTLGDANLRAGNLQGARSAYEQLLKISPDDADALNNLAQAALKQNDKAAVGFAERAFALRPSDAGIIDTLGWILVRQGQLDRGLAHLRDARLRNPDNPEIRYHLAAALSLAGRKNEAREELTQSLKTGIAFHGIDDARKLQAELAR